MSASDAFESDILQLLLNNTNIANIGDVTGLRGSTTAGSVWVALHSSDPGEAGNQSTNELSYTGYLRIAVARSGAGWTISGTAPTQAANAVAVTFGACTGGPVTATHFSVGYQSAGATKIIISGALTTPLSITAAPSITPNFAINTLVGTCD